MEKPEARADVVIDLDGMVHVRSEKNVCTTKRKQQKDVNDNLSSTNPITIDSDDKEVEKNTREKNPPVRESPKPKLKKSKNSDANGGKSKKNTAPGSKKRKDQAGDTESDDSRLKGTLTGTKKRKHADGGNESDDSVVEEKPQYASDKQLRDRFQYRMDHLNLFLKEKRYSWAQSILHSFYYVALKEGVLNKEVFFIRHPFRNESKINGRERTMVEVWPSVDERALAALLHRFLHLRCDKLRYLKFECQNVPQEMQ